MTRFDSSYEGLPAARFETAQEYDQFRRALIEARYSFKTKVVPPKGNRRSREIIVMLVSTRGPDVG